MPISADKTLEAIDAAIMDRHSERHSRRVSISSLGRPCDRELWFKFHWVAKSKFGARMLRLFDRGHKEESRFVEWLRNAGVTVWDMDSDGNQFGVEFCDGHCGGYIDSVVQNLPDLPPGTSCLTEYKTHGQKSFDGVVSKHLKEAKIEHYVQIQMYMFHYGFEWGLYCAINKNTDELYFELVYKDPITVEHYLNRAQKIIDSPVPLKRISDSPGWYQCRMCSYRPYCHGDAVPEINCRTCCHSTPVAGGKWKCEYQSNDLLECIIGEDTMKVGCEHHIYNPHIFNKVQLLGSDSDYVELKLQNGDIIKHGPNYVTSEQLCNAGTINKKP